MVYNTTESKKNMVFFSGLLLSQNTKSFSRENKEEKKNFMFMMFEGGMWQSMSTCFDLSI